MFFLPVTPIIGSRAPGCARALPQVSGGQAQYLGLRCFSLARAISPTHSINGCYTLLLADTSVLSPDAPCTQLPLGTSGKHSPDTG